MSSQPRLMLEAVLTSVCAVLLSAALGTRATIDHQARALAERIADSHLQAGAAPAYPRTGSAVRPACATDDLAGLRLIPGRCRACGR